jgi:hypothetical protein
MTNRFPNWDEIWTDNNPFGKTLLGDWSLAELQELINAKDKDFQVLESAYANTQSAQWPSPAVLADWVNDWTALKARYNTARNAALGVLKAFNSGWGFTPISMTSGEPFYTKVLRAIKQDPTTVSKGDLDDVNHRLNAIKPIPVYSVPQPNKSNDLISTISEKLAPYDPIGNPQARANWTRDLAIGIGASLVGGVILLSLYKKV